MPREKRKVKYTSLNVTQEAYDIWTELSNRYGLKRQDVFEMAIRALAKESDKKKVPSA